MFRYMPFHQEFHQRLKCFKNDENIDRTQLNFGGKVLLPTSVLQNIMMTSEGDSPIMIFALENCLNTIKICVGVLEFTAVEGTIIVPSWMYRQLEIDIPGTLVEVTLANPPLGTYAKFQPLSFDFLDIENPKVILEKALRNYTCINTNDCIEISYCDKTYQLMVKETKPDYSICVINCNLMVEFEPVPGYDEYQERLNMNRFTLNLQSKIDKYIEDTNALHFQPFQGSSSRLDGKKKKKLKIPSYISSSTSSTVNQNSETIKIQGSNIENGYPDYDWKFGKLTFDKYFHKRVQLEIDEKKKEGENNKEKSLFPGSGKRIP